MNKFWRTSTTNKTWRIFIVTWVLEDICTDPVLKDIYTRDGGRLQRQGWRTFTLMLEDIYTDRVGGCFLVSGLYNIYPDRGLKDIYTNRKLEDIYTDNGLEDIYSEGRRTFTLTERWTLTLTKKWKIRSKKFYTLTESATGCRMTRRSQYPAIIKTVSAITASQLLMHTSQETDYPFWMGMQFQAGAKRLFHLNIKRYISQNKFINWKFV